MEEHARDLNDEDRLVWRKKVIDELVRRGWRKSAIAVEAGMESSTGLYGYFRPGGTVHGRFGFALDGFLINALDAGTPGDYNRARGDGFRQTKTPGAITRERLQAARGALEYASSLLADLEHELEGNEAPKAGSGTPGS